MTTEHPITPPPELVQQWWKDAQANLAPDCVCWLHHTATQAARWGADQELDAVCDEILHCVAGIYEDKVSDWPGLVDLLREGRRPKPPSLKEQALLAIDTAVADGRLSPDVSNVVRRALEQLP